GPSWNLPKMPAIGTGRCICQAQVEQAQAELQARQARGTLEAEAEVARRSKELADARAALALPEAGSRTEEIEAQRARQALLEEETRYLEKLQDKLCLHSPVAGLITTPRLKDKIGQYLHEGELVCVVEAAEVLEAEVTIAEQDLVRVLPGQSIS